MRDEAGIRHVKTSTASGVERHDCLGGFPNLLIGSLLMLKSLFPIPIRLFRSVGFTCGLVVRYLCVSLFTRGYGMSTRIPGAAIA